MRNIFIAIAVVLSVGVNCMSARSADELPLPAGPADMTTPEERAGYILGHFWDAMDFTDARLSHDRSFMEQNLVNFFSVMPHASSASVAEGVKGLMSKAASDSVSYRLVLELAEHYLYEHGSPMRDEESFIPFLEIAVDSPQLTEAERIRPKYLLEEAMMNRVGTLSADFEMTLRDGSKSTMHEYGKGSRMLLMFYDPDCRHCAEVIEMLDSDADFNGLLDRGALKVLAVYPFGEEDVWKSPMVKIPSKWTDAMADLVEVDIYSFPEMPVLYLLDESGKVVLKDVGAEKIVEHVKSMK